MLVNFLMSPMMSLRKIEIIDYQVLLNCYMYLA